MRELNICSAYEVEIKLQNPTVCYHLAALIVANQPIDANPGRDTRLRVRGLKMIVLGP